MRTSERHLPAILIAAAMACGTCGGYAWAGPSPELDATTILRKSMTDGERVPLKGSLSVVQWWSSGAHATEAEVLQDGTGRYRHEYDAPRRMHGSIVVFDGRDLWRYDPKQKVIRVTRLPSSEAASQSQALDLIRRNYAIRLAGRGRVAGRPVYVVRLEPREAGKASQTRWIDCKTFKTLRVEKRTAEGVLAYRVRLSDVTMPAAVPADAFRLRVHRGVRVIRAPADPPALQGPALLREARRFGIMERAPLGFVLRRGITTRNGSFHAVYFDGLDTFSVFVQRAPRLPGKPRNAWKPLATGGVPAYTATTANGQAILWWCHGLRYTVFSRLAPRAARAFAVHWLREHRSSSSH